MPSWALHNTTPTASTHTLEISDVPLPFSVMLSREGALRGLIIQIPLGYFSGIYSSSGEWECIRSAKSRGRWLSQDSKSPQIHTHSAFPSPLAPFCPFLLTFCLWLSVTHILGCKGILISPSSETGKTHNHEWVGLRRKQTWLYPDSAMLPINIGCTFRQATTLGTQRYSTGCQLLRAGNATWQLLFLIH